MIQESKDRIITSEDLISVVVPTYKRRDWIGQCIKSILDQTYRSFEIIVVDDGSDDDTESIVRALDTDARIRYFRQKNQGPASARNKGIKEAKGNWIAFLDSDDQWLPWKLEVQVKVMKSLPHISLFFTDYSAKDATHKIESYIRDYYPIFKRNNLKYSQIFEYSKTLNELINWENISEIDGGTRVYWGNIFYWIFQGNFIPTLTVLGRKSIFIELGGMNEAFRGGEDSDFYLRYSFKNQACFIDVVTANASLNAADRLTGSISISINWLESIKNILNKYPEFVSENKRLVLSQLALRAYKTGKILIRNGQKEVGRKYLKEAVSYNKLCVRAWILILISFMPICTARLIYRNVKNRFL
jgi:glycosyltransferase involved in cell wall biosynthesis